MRKSHICLALIFLVGIAVFVIPALPSSPIDPSANWGLISGVLVLLAVAAFFFEFESYALSSKELALVSMLGTMSAVLRIPFVALPNVQPSTYLIICSGYVFGPVAGFMVGAMTPLISNLFLGMGPWTPYQMFAWGLAGVSAAYFKRLGPNRVWLTLFAILWGYVYGVIMDTWFWATFVYPLTLRTFIVTKTSGLWLDTFHAIGNGILFSLFGMRTISILERFRKRFNFRGIIPFQMELK